MNILAIDTSTEILGLCLCMGDSITTVTVKKGLKHSNNLLPCIQNIMHGSSLGFQDLNLIVFAIGPGSFTGLRIGLSTVKGISSGTGCPMVGIPTLDSLAARFAFYNGLVLPVYDARKDRYYTAAFYHGNRISDYQDLDLPALRHLLQNTLAECNHSQTFQNTSHTDTLSHVLFTGKDALSVIKKLKSIDNANINCDTRFIGTDPYSLMNLGRKHFYTFGRDSDTIAPMYIRKSEAEMMLNR